MHLVPENVPGLGVWGSSSGKAPFDCLEKNILSQLNHMRMVNSMTDLSNWSTTCVCFFWTSPPFYQARAVFSREKHLSCQSHRYNINFFKMFGQTSLISWGLHDKKKKQWTKGVKGENGIWHKSKEKRESLLVGGDEFSCQGIFPSQSTLHIIM